MSTYLDSASITELIKVKNRIFSVRKTAFSKYHLDILDNDVLSSLSIWEIVSQYDTNYDINFARTKEDAISNGVLIEQKCSKVDGFERNGNFIEAIFNKKTNRYPNSKTDKKNTASFQFHAEGDLEYPRYIFAVRRKDTLKLLRLYDISSTGNVNMVQKHLLAEKLKWLSKGKKKHDVIMISEKVLLEKLLKISKMTINDCELLRD